MKKTAASKIAVMIMAIAALMAVPAAAQPTVDMDLDDPNYVLGTAVSTGDTIGIDYSVSVDRTSPTSLDGYCMHFTVTDPSGNEDTGWACRDTTVSPGSYDDGTINTGVTADEEGTWNAEVTIYDSDKDDQFKTSTMDFEVSETQPAVAFTITDVVAYGTTAAVSIFGLALATSSRFRGWITG